MQLKTNMQLTFTTLALLLFLSCSNSTEPDPSLDGLFDTPTPTEIAAVKADWASRDLSVQNYRVLHSETILDDRATLKIVAFMVDDHTEYGALVVPISTEKMPVRMLINGFQQGLITNSQTINYGPNALDNPFILAIPALRGQSLNLTINGVTYTSPTSDGNHCDAFDGTVNGTLAFVNVIGETEPNTDMDRIGVSGGSRGGTVALLMAVRNPKIKLVIGMVGPTNMLDLTSNNSTDPTYICQFLSDLQEGTVSKEETRLKLIASSPLFFAENLPATQLHFGADDTIVPKEQGTALQSRMENLGNIDLLDLHIYEGRNHQNLGVNNSLLQERVAAFWSNL